MESIKQVGQKIEILNRESLEVLGAEEVLSSTEKEVYVKLEKEILQVLGEGLKITKLSPDEKLLMVSGKVNGVLYITKLTKKSLFGRVFK